METISKSHLRQLVNAVQKISLARDLDSVMKIVRTAAREITGADGATFVLRDGDLCYYADEDAISPLWKGHRFPISTCISGWAMVNKQPVAIEDIYQDERIPHSAYAPTFVKSLAMVPIRTMEPIGAIGNYWAKQRMPTSDEIEILQALADSTSVALENVQVYAELEQRVRKRTEELVNLNKEMESFSYSVSHDLRAPLRAIHGFSKILKEDHAVSLNEEGGELLTEITKHADEMAHLIDDLLEFSRMGRKELQKEPIQLSSMVNNICTAIQMQKPGRTIVFTVQDLPEAPADASLLKQVWMNLISNAVKYSGQKPESLVEIGSKELDDHWEFYVKDNGAGFDMRYYDKMFGAFQRLHGKAEFEGTGIGLAIVHKIVTRHGGEVRAEGKVDEGAVFYFTLPKESH